MVKLKQIIVFTKCLHDLTTVKLTTVSVPFLLNATLYSTQAQVFIVILSIDSTVNCNNIRSLSCCSTGSVPKFAFILLLKLTTSQWICRFFSRIWQKMKIQMYTKDEQAAGLGRLTMWTTLQKEILSPQPMMWDYCVCKDTMLMASLLWFILIPHGELCHVEN